jgi:hypothetical protein
MTTNDLFPNWRANDDKCAHFGRRPFYLIQRPGEILDFLLQFLKEILECHGKLLNASRLDYEGQRAQLLCFN